MKTIAEPAARAVHRRSEVHRDERKGDEAETRPDERRLAIEPVVDAHHDVQHRDAEQRPHALLDEKKRSAAVAVLRHRRRRAVDHHDAQRDEQNRGDEQHVVGLEFSCHAL
jgi:hypothetical protein